MGSQIVAQCPSHRTQAKAVPAAKGTAFDPYAWLGPWPYAANLRSMRRYAYRGWYLSVADLRTCRKTLRTALEIYGVDCGQRQRRSTEQRKRLRKIKTAARRYIDTRKRLWSEKLLNYLDDLDPNTIVALRCYFNIDLEDWERFKRKLRNIFSFNECLSMRSL
jgi:hypothetical protein